LAICAARSLFAEPPSIAPRTAFTNEVGHVERVLIPTDSSGRPVGSKYFVSEDFLRRLLAPPDVPPQHGWILYGATYKGELRQRPDAEDIATADWLITLDIEVLARDTAIVLPFKRGEAAWSDTAMLDGVPFPVVWGADGRSCTIEVGEPGRYSAAFSCTPRIDAGGRRKRIGLTIPPRTGARLELEYPHQLAGLTVAGAEAAQHPGDTPALHEFTLNANGQLEVGWPADALADGPQNLSVSALRWLRIAADEVTLEAKYLVGGTARRPEALTVSYDGRWELIGPDISRAALNPGQDSRRQRLVRVPLAPGEFDRQSMTLVWRLREAETFGRLRLPPIELVSMPATNRWLAISSDPGMDCEIIGATATPGSVSDFQALWGESDETPRMVVGNLPADTDWHLEVRPRDSESLIEEAIHVAAASDASRVLYQADVTPNRKHQYQIELAVPSDLAVEQVTLSDSDSRVPLRWVRLNDSRINVFFARCVSGTYRLALRGRMPPAGDGQKLPRITMLPNGSASQKVLVYREADVLATVSGLSESNAVPIGSREPPPAEWAARLVGDFALDANDFSRARLKVRPNNVRLAGKTLLSLSRHTDGWIAAFNAVVNVKRGQLDTLKLLVPSGWSGPFAVDSNVPATLEQPNDAEKTELLIRFAESIGPGDAVAVSVSGRLMPALQSGVAVPEFVSEPPVRGERYISVPSHSDSEPLNWTETGVRPASLPEELRAMIHPSEEVKTFEAHESTFRVALQPAGRRPSPELHLADTTARLSAAGGQVIETHFVLVAPELADCTLQLPRGQELVSVQIDHHAALLEAVDTNRWRVLIGPTPLPQIIEVVALVRANDAGRHTIERPRLLAHGQPIPVNVSLWSIGYAQSAAAPQVEGADRVTEAEQQAFRLERLVSVVELAMPAAVELPYPDGYRWYRSWAQRLTKVRERSAHAVNTIRGPARSQISASAEDQLAGASGRLEQWIEQGEQLLANAARPATSARGDEPSESESAASPPAGPWIYCVAGGGTEQLVVDTAPGAASPSQVRWVGLLAIGCGAAAIVWLTRRPATADFLYRWPHAAGFVVGFVYWAWLWPSWLGLLIAAGSLILVWWPGWPGRTLPAERSTVLRLARSDVVPP
jgi:hypothetical protein